MVSEETKKIMDNLDKIQKDMIKRLNEDVEKLVKIRKEIEDEYAHKK